MNILITGKIGSLAFKFAQAINEENKAIIVAEKLPKQKLGSNEVRTYRVSPQDKLFGHIIELNGIDVMVYFLLRSEEAATSVNTVDANGSPVEFAVVLEHCRAKNVAHIILISSSEIYSGWPDEDVSESSKAAPAGVNGKLIKTAEDLSRYYQIKLSGSITIVHLPYVYYPKQDVQSGLNDALITKVILDAVNKKEVTLPGFPFTKCDFLRVDDVVHLLLLTADKRVFQRDIEVVNAGTGNPITFADLEHLIKAEYPDVSINYNNVDAEVPFSMMIETAKTAYDWVSLNSIDEDFHDICFDYAKESNRKGVVAKLKGLRVKRFYIALEFALTSVVMQMLVMKFDASSVSGFIDFRLLYVVILSSLHGIAGGIMSALLAMGSLLFSSLNSDWRMILYNPENWLPFVIYLTVGAALGYTGDKKRDDLVNAYEQIRTMELLNEHLSSLLDQAAQSSENYKNQILGQRDSFGKIFSVVRKLDNELQENVLSEAISILQDLLDTQSIAVYSIAANGAYARLTVRSRSLTDITQKSIKLSEYEAMTLEISPGSVWFNRDLLPGYPAYCAPIYSENNIVAFVMINKVRTDQMNLYYSNKVMILCGLIQDALVRAIKYHHGNEEKNYIHGTRIMTQDAFADVYRANQKLAEQEKIQLSTILVKANGQDLDEVSSKLENCVRETDSMGILANGAFGICLTHISLDDLQKVLKRLENYGMTGISMDASSNIL
ncbi:NAD(P)-dependent oxidoreductase [Lachnospiraceae bacterium ZAX-1]